MKKIFAISDIHGCLDVFLEMLDIIKYDPKQHQLILLGDYVDRGPNSKEVVEKVMELQKDGAIVLRGNHDQMFIEFIDKLDTLGLHNGLITTLNSYFGDFNLTMGDVKKVQEYIIQNYSHHIEFLKSLPYYYETKNHIFVHAGIDPNLKNWKDEMIQEDMLWIRDEFIYNNHKLDQTIIVGHTPTLNILGHRSPVPYFGNKKIMIDGGYCFGYQLNCLEINNDENHGYRYYSISHKQKEEGQ